MSCPQRWQGWDEGIVSKDDLELSVKISWWKSGWLYTRAGLRVVALVLLVR